MASTNQSVIVGITPTDFLTPNIGFFGSIDNTHFHDYTLSGDFSTGMFYFAVDGVTLGNPTAISDTVNRGILFGDGTPSGSNAEAEITQ